MDGFPEGRYWPGLHSPVVISAGLYLTPEGEAALDADLAAGTEMETEAGNLKFRAGTTVDPALTPDRGSLHKLVLNAKTEPKPEPQPEQEAEAGG